MQAKKPLPGRAVILTFDDGYHDFAQYAWPLLEQYGFAAHVFLVADAIGQTSTWDHIYDQETPLLDWPEIARLEAQGVAFGSHMASHRPLTALSIAQIVCEAARSRTILEQGLQRIDNIRRPIKTVAYPYGDADPVVRHLVGACGYTIGLSRESRLCQFQDDLLALPRIEISGADHTSEFIAKLVL
jgi:peptidoglycan/xylan/chitin deacetylase (PgdA/CDA1 family)